MNFRKAETPEKMSITKDEYIKSQVERESLKYQKQMAVDYILNHKVLDRKVIGKVRREAK